MEINIEENLKCSKCGAINNAEHFSHQDGEGVRCRRCGHEKLKPKPKEDHWDIPKWVAEKRLESFNNP